MAGDQELFHQGREEREPQGPSTGPPKEDKGPIRKSIADLARSFVAEGHYLEGTAGSTPPNGADGNPGGAKRSNCKLLPASFNTDPKETTPGKVISVCTALQKEVKGFNTCSGRSQKFSQPPASAINPYLQAVKEAQTRTADQAFWPGFGANKLHPRRYFLDTKLEERGAIIWGESCIGRRHFDCLGLVNFCFEEHTTSQGKAGWAFEIKQYFDCLITGTSNQGHLDPSKVMDGDIVVRFKPHDHIGLLYRKGGTVFVVQANETKAGLTDTEVYKPSDWGRTVRVRDEFLVKRKHQLKDGNGK